MNEKDQIRLGPEISPGRRATFRRRDGEVTTGSLGGVKDGQPIPEGAELIAYGAPDADGWRDVKVLYRHSNEPVPAVPEPRVEERKASGPAQVATPRYREGYDRIFGKKQKVGLA